MGFESTYHWVDPIFTGIVFGTVMATLISICYYSLISVCAYTSLFILMCVSGLKLYTYVMVTFLKKETADKHPRRCALKSECVSWHFLFSTAGDRVVKVSVCVVAVSVRIRIGLNLRICHLCYHISYDTWHFKS